MKTLPDGRRLPRWRPLATQERVSLTALLEPAPP
jgi:hypothetical protein